MIIFGKQFASLVKLLKQSKQEFRFDQQQIKIRLMQSLASREPAVQFQTLNLKHFSFNPYAVAVTAVILCVTATFAFAQNAQPGDKLFGLQKFQEQAILSLPLNATTKAKIRANIVAKRLRSLEQAEKSSDQTQAKLASIKESEAALNDAYEHIHQSRVLLTATGPSTDLQELDSSLKRISDLAEQQEQSIQNLETYLNDQGTKIEIDQHLNAIGQTKAKARLELAVPDLGN